MSYLQDSFLKFIHEILERLILQNSIKNADAKKLPEEFWMLSTFQDHPNGKKKKYSKHHIRLNQRA